MKRRIKRRGQSRWWTFLSEMPNKPIYIYNNCRGFIGPLFFIMRNIYNAGDWVSNLHVHVVIELKKLMIKIIKIN